MNVLTMLVLSRALDHGRFQRIDNALYTDRPVMAASKISGATKKPIT